MRKILLFILLCIPILTNAQTTQVSGTVTGADGQTWNNGTYSFDFVPAPRFQGTYNLSGAPFTPISVKGSLSASGTFTNVVVSSNTSITPSNTGWSFTACPQVSGQCFTTVSITITGASQTITSFITPPAIVVNCGVGVSTYLDSEVNCGVGGTYYNLISQTPRVCQVASGNTCSTWANAGSGGGLGSPALPATANLIAENLFLDGSGTVMSDSSGNGNTLTLAAAGAAPTVNSVASGGGLTFNSANNQFASWPAAVNSAKTIIIAMSFQQGLGTLPSNIFNANYMNMLVGGSSAPANSMSWFLFQNYTTDAFSPGSQGASHFRTLSPAGSFNSSSSCNFLGTGVVALSLAAPDTFYINGVPCINRQTGSSVGQQTTGVLQVGGSSATGFTNTVFFNGTMYCVAAWNIALTAPQVAQASQALQSSCLVQRGITPFLGGATNGTSVALQDTHSSNVLEGDSLFAGINIPAQGINGVPPSTSDTAIGGTGTFGILSRFALNDAPLYRPGVTRNTFIEWAGTNDVTSGATPDQIVGSLCGTAKLAERTGFNTYFATMISRTGQEVNRDNLNPIIRQYIPTCANTYVGITDLGANTHLGCDGCSANTTYFTVDAIHLSSFSAINIVGPYYVFAFNRANGNKVGSASFTTYTGTGLGIPTLMQTVDCTGLSGASVTCTQPWNTTAASLVTVTVLCFNCAGVTINAPTDSQGLTYTALAAQATFNTVSQFRSFAAPNSTAAASTITQTFTGGTPSSISITVQEWGQILTAAPLDVASVIATGNSISPASANVTTTLSGDLLFGYMASAGGAASVPYGTYIQPNSPFTLANDLIGLGAQSRVTGAAGSYATGATLPQTSSWAMGTAAFKATTATSTFQLQAADIYAECAPNGTNNVILILPDGTPMTGGTVTIKNNQTAGAATCVVNAPTPYATGVQQTIDGATSVTIANKATAVFKSKYSFTGTAGSSLVPVITWEQLQNN